MNIILDSTGRVLMYSDNGTPTPDEGNTLVTLSGEDRDSFIAATQIPNDGITFDGKTFSAIPQQPKEPQ